MKQLVKATSLTGQSQVYLLSQHSTLGKGQVDSLVTAAAESYRNSASLSSGVDVSRDLNDHVLHS